MTMGAKATARPRSSRRRTVRDGDSVGRPPAPDRIDAQRVRPTSLADVTTTTELATIVGNAVAQAISAYERMRSVAPVAAAVATSGSVGPHDSPDHRGWSKDPALPPRLNPSDLERLQHEMGLDEFAIELLPEAVPVQHGRDVESARERVDAFAFDGCSSRPARSPVPAGAGFRSVGLVPVESPLGPDADPPAPGSAQWTQEEALTSGDEQIVEWLAGELRAGHGTRTTPPATVATDAPGGADACAGVVSATHRTREQIRPAATFLRTLWDRMLQAPRAQQAK